MSGVTTQGHVEEHVAGGGRTGPSAPAAPRVLLVDSSRSGSVEPCPVWNEVINYGALRRVPRWIRSCEELSRLDVSLAREARRIAHGFDLLVAGSEKVGIPLACMRPSRPIICVVHQIASPQKRRLLTSLGILSRWSRIGYQCGADRDLLASYYGVPAARLIKFKAAPLEAFVPDSRHAGDGGYVLSVGTSKRDYHTFFDALRGLPGMRARVYVSSRYFDPYRGRLPLPSTATIAIEAHVDALRMPEVYQGSRFVVLPIQPTYQYSAGATVALEAHAAGKAVVATRTPGMSDYVVDGTTGFLVSPSDAGAMREAIVRLWNDPGLARTMGLAGRAHVEREFNPDIVDRQILEAYAEVCREHAATR